MKRNIIITVIVLVVIAIVGLSIYLFPKEDYYDEVIVMKRPPSGIILDGLDEKTRDEVLAIMDSDENARNTSIYKIMAIEDTDGIYHIIPEQSIKRKSLILEGPGGYIVDLNEKSIDFVRRM